MIHASLSGGEEVGCYGSLQHGSLLESSSPISAYLYCVGICPFGVFFILIEGLAQRNVRSVTVGLFDAQTTAAVPDAEAGVNPLCHR